MPELPEVETIRRDLEHAVLGKKITDVEILTPRLVKGVITSFRSALQGNQFTEVSRRGKLLFFSISGGDKTLLVHLKMTGQLVCQIPGGIIVGGHPSAKIEDLPNKYTHVCFEFEDYSRLFFNDVRTFGYLKMVDEDEKRDVLKRFGLEPLTSDFTWENFSQLMAGRRGVLKAILLNQQILAGIGNIYADEICFRAKLKPDRKADTLTKQEVKRLFNACQNIMSQAVEKRGTTFSNFVDASGRKGGYYPYLKVYNHSGENCARCKNGTIHKMRLAGRGTHYCTSCQH